MPLNRRDVLTIAGAGLMIAFLAIRYVLKLSTPYHGAHCSANLKQISLSFELFAQDHHGLYPMQVSTNEGGTLEYITSPAFVHFQALSNELGNPRFLLCPAERLPQTDSFTHLCDRNASYFLNIDGAASSRTVVLAGDRHIQRIAPVGGSIMEVFGTQKIHWSRELHSKFFSSRGNVVFPNGAWSLTTNAFTLSNSETDKDKHYRLSIPQR